MSRRSGSTTRRGATGSARGGDDDMKMLWSCHSICQIAGRKRRFSRSFRERLEELSLERLGCGLEEGVAVVAAGLIAAALVLGVPALASVVYMALI